MPAEASTPRRVNKDVKPPSPADDERSTLLGFLDYLRDAIAGKLEGAPEPQVREPGVPSGTNLLGLVKHITAVERFGFLGEDAKSWPKTFRPTAKDTVDSVLADYRAAVERANERVLACTDLSQPAAASPARGSSPTMRWALTHMIEGPVGTPGTPTSCASRSTAPRAADAGARRSQPRRPIDGELVRHRA
jgi:hypothetical protein